jgi:hypothetical protein
VSERVHSSYQRHLSDIAAGGRELLIDLQAFQAAGNLYLVVLLKLG